MTTLTQQTLDLGSNVCHNPLAWKFAMHVKNVILKILSNDE